jgi:hypothetical protein
MLGICWLPENRLDDNDDGDDYYILLLQLGRLVQK